MSRLLLRRFFSPSAREEVKPGDIFGRQHGNRILETATVLDLRDDLLGIRHVRFNVAFERSDTGRVGEGLRILALSSFMDAYRERVR